MAAVATRWPLVGRRDELDVFTLALQDAGRQAMCVYGPSGVGKTRLGEECLAVAEADGRRVLRATADQAGSAVPLAAVAHLLPARALMDWHEGGERGSVMRTRLLDTTARGLAPAAGESGRVVLLLDDAHRFDQSSLTVVDHLLARRAVFVVATINSGGPVPETVTEWWRTERALRVDLGELDPVGVDTLLHVVLEGLIDGSASAEFWAASHGNVLILHELVLGALARGSLSQRDGVWHHDGPLVSSALLGDLVARRVDELTSVGRAVLDLLALCQPVGVGHLESSFGLEVLEALERDGLISARTDGRRQSVSLAHPLHREVIRAGLADSQARSILLGHAEMLERCGARRREDPVRIATLRLEATGQADPDLLLRGARVARSDNDFAAAARLAEAALAARPTALGGLLLGEALFNLGRFEQAEAVLAAAVQRAPDDDGIGAAITTMRRRNLFVGCRRDDEAVQAGRTAARAMPVSAHAELLAGEAEVLVYSGRPLDALAVLERVDVSDPRVRVLAAIPKAAALAMTGRTAEALALSRHAYREHLVLDDSLGVPSPDQHRVNEVFALVQSGHLAEADERGSACFEVALRARLPIEMAWLAVQVARCALVQGRPSTALGWVDRASTAINAARLDGLRQIASAFRAAAHGVLGHAAASAAAVDESDRATSGFGSLAVEVPLGRAWALVAAGDQGSARDELLAAADHAERSGFVPASAWLLHDVARLGAPDVVAPRLALLAAATDSELVPLLAQHAAALVAADGDRLAAVAERFDAIGAVLLAAEAAAQAADSSRHHDERRAAALDAYSGTLAERCESARTPALAQARTIGPLRGREREVAMLAADGLSSRDIAARLSLSVRTVDNHLGRVYAKLGVGSRAELAAALEPDRREDGRR